MGQPTALDVATLILAVIGTVTGLGSLGWLVLAHRLTGPRVKVTLRAGYDNPDGEFVTLPIDSFPTLAQPESHPRAIVVVQAKNLGRSPIQIVTWWVEVGDGDAKVVAGRDPKNPLPHLLGPGEAYFGSVELTTVQNVLALLDATERHAP